jgi:hypothetical protein
LFARVADDGAAVDAFDRVYAIGQHNGAKSPAAAADIHEAASVDGFAGNAARHDIEITLPPLPTTNRPLLSTMVWLATPPLYTSSNPPELTVMDSVAPFENTYMSMPLVSTVSLVTPEDTLIVPVMAAPLRPGRTSLRASQPFRVYC